MIIKNFTELSQTKLRRTALEIIEAGIEAVLPENILKAQVQFDKATKILSILEDNYNLAKGRLFIIGGGKAAGAMANAIETIIPPEEITAGIVNCNSSDYSPKKTKINIASHPKPDERGIIGVQQMLAFKDDYSINDQDIVLCLLSGGGSALMPSPVDGVSLEEYQKITELLLNCGAEIHEINTIRKHLSEIKGGQMGKFFAPATVISLIISDVVGNDLSSIASGPTTPDKSTFEYALKILNKYDLIDKAPKKIISYINANIGKPENETPKSFDNCKNYIIMDNQIALNGMKAAAKALGYRPLVVTSGLIGKPEEAAWAMAKEISEGKYHDYDVLLLSGETTPVIPSEAGTGGRNQHFAAVSMQTMANYPRTWVLASVATDGADFVPGVAGAIVDNESLINAVEKGLDVDSYIKSYDSNSLLSELNNSIVMADNTGTNVGDIIVYILESYSD